jgi:mannitol/fructose-specific phosphotransferase system IIA component (Ntr-type)
VVPVLVVHPILTDEDRRYILSNSMVAAFNNSGFSRRLFDVVSKYVDPADHEALQKDIALFLAGSFTPDKPAENERALGLPELLDLSRIRMVDTKVKWTDAVYLAGEPLLHNGSIIEHYLDAVVTQTMYYGPYMFITDHIMLAHAKPEDGVNRRDVSLASFKEPVFFPAGRQAKIIIVLSAEDNEKHLKILNDLLTFAEDEENLKALEEAESAAGILALLKEKLR